MNSMVIFVVFLINWCLIECKPINNEAESFETEDLLSTSNTSGNNMNSPRMTISSSMPDEVELIQPTVMHQQQTFRPAVDSIFELIFAVCKH